MTVSEFKGLKLSTGEEILGKVREESDYYIVENTVVTVMVPKGIGMITWPQLSDGKPIKIDKKHVMCLFNVNYDVAEGYQQKFGGIVTASAGVLDQLNVRLDRR